MASDGRRAESLPRPDGLYLALISLTGERGPANPRCPEETQRSAPLGPFGPAGSHLSLTCQHWLGGRRRVVFERFTDRARRVVVLAQEEAGMLNHNYIGTEHILLGLIREGEGIAARALESLGISLETVRQQVEAIIGQGQQAPAGHIPFTPRAKRVLELSLREALQLGHNYIGTEHILLGLIREGEGIATQVLVRLGADLIRVREQVIQLVHDKEPETGPTAQPTRLGLLSQLESRLHLVETRVAAIERRVGAGPDTRDLDDQIEVARREKQSAIDAREYERAASLRDHEKQLLASRAACHEEWAAQHPGLSSLAEQCRQLSAEIERLGGLLRQHGIDPQDRPA
jgi:Clp amino terminal domain, pathogenicity island component